MKRYSSVIVLLFSGIFQLIAQPSPALIKDSLDLENAKKIVLSLKDSAKVDMMNKIAQRTGYISSKQTRIAISFQYATEALKVANRIGYKAGIAKALLTLSATSNDSSMNMPGQIATKEQYARQARLLAEEINNYELLGWCYYILAGVDSIAKSNNDTLIAYWKISIDYFLKARDTLHAAEVTNWIYNTFEENGAYETAFAYAKKARDLSLKSGNDFSISWKQFLVQYSAGSMSELYSSVGDYETAMNYMREDNLYAINNKTGWLRNGSIAELFCQMGQYDSALVYWNKWRNAPDWSSAGKGHQAWGYGILGQIYLNTNQYDKAIEIFRNWSDTLKKFHPAGVYATIRMSLLIGQAHQGKKNYDVALQFGKQSFQLAQEKNNRPEMMRVFQLLSQVYHHLGNNDSAYEYIIKYNAIRDSIQNKQFLLRIYNSKKEAEDARKEAQIGLLNKDNLIKSQQLKQEATFRNFIIAVFIAMVFAGLFVFRQINLKRKNERLRQEKKEQDWKLSHLESENKHVELQKQAAELEMQALRAQMNPHFIFNCLSSINRFILKNESKAASNYLTRFSRLIRIVLINSQKPMIALEEELEMLKLYLDMERLRFKNSFDYVISSKNEIDTEAVLIPPLILQPICENALWHGLMHKEGQGHLTIELSMEDNVLQCVIADDGIGREKAAELKSKSVEKEKSMGLQITAQRLALINQNNNVQTFYTIEDITDENKNIAGTRVTLKIRYKELTEEFA